MFQPLLIFYRKNKILYSYKLSSTNLLYHRKTKTKTANLILRNREAFEKTPSGTKSSSQTAWGAVADVRRFVGKKSKSWIVERVSGIEPPSRPWQGRIIATIPRPQILTAFKIVISCLLLDKSSKNFQLLTIN